MPNQLKEISISAFTLSLIVAYFACLGYSTAFHFDMTTFLSVEDLIMIFSKWIWLSVFSLIIAINTIYTVFNRSGNPESWWSKRIGRTMLKRRAIIIIPILIAIIICVFIYDPLRDILVATLGIGFFIFLLVISILFVISILEDKKEISEIKGENWIAIVYVITLFIIISIFSGGVFAGKLTPDNIKVEFDDCVINTSDSSDLIYIGKTSNYFFLYNTKTQNSTAFSMDKVKYFEIIETKKNLP